jgi:nicotinate-nucleotide adenylyltransferase
LKRVGVLGGTFDPPHFGHLRAAEVVREAFGLEKVLFVPAKTPPHKASPEVSEARHRLRMTELAAANERYFDVSRVELERESPSYTIDTLAELSAQMPDAGLFFIAGTDAFLEIPTWHRFRDLVSRHSFVVHERPGFPLKDVRELVSRELETTVVEESALESELGSHRARIFLLPRHGDMLDVSSTAIRSTVREGRSVRFLVPDAVEAYIREFRLYE